MNSKAGEPGANAPMAPEGEGRVNTVPLGIEPVPPSAPTVPAAPAPGGGQPPAAAPPLAEGQVRIRLFGRTDVGRIREHNEDNFLVADLSQGARGLMENIRTHIVGQNGTLFAVCDGMGGAAAGEVASKLAVDIIYEQMQAGGPPRNRDDFARRLVRAVEVAGMRIFAEAKLDRNRRGMGTTATAAALVDDHLFLAQVGDSRGYLLRGDQLQLVTRDQSLVNQLIEAGQLTEEEAENFEHSNIILQALGTADSVQVDLTYVKVRAGDTLLLCSDGLSGMVRAEELRQALLAHPEPIDVCKVLTDRANDAGGHDNITVIVVKFDGPRPPSPEDDPVKYTKYVFQTEDTTQYPPMDTQPAPARPPSVAPGAQSDATRATPPGAPGNHRLAATQVGGNHAELIAQLQGSSDEAGAVAAAPGATANPRPHSEVELRAAGVPSSASASPWLWVAALLAIGLLVVGVYALVGGKLPP
ncbi:MAG: Stp1/IreP family PP2C-type Ser/Thr phosphatase [Deltaproteobacteria bacterium]|nr:Stp1/IreP family PP2C-type Ser/Thr phosphatase [Deltaproteobacteria bacterium]